MMNTILLVAQTALEAILTEENPVLTPVWGGQR